MQDDDFTGLPEESESILLLALASLDTDENDDELNDWFAD